MQSVKATKQIPVTVNYPDGTSVEYDLASARERKAFLNNTDAALKLKDYEIEELQKEVTCLNVALQKEVNTIRMLTILVVVSILVTVGLLIYVF